MDADSGRHLRLLSVIPALGVGGWLVYISWAGPLKNIFGVQDSPTYVYLLVGVPLLLPGLFLIGYALRTLTHRGKSRNTRQG